MARSHLFPWLLGAALALAVGVLALRTGDLAGRLDALESGAPPVAPGPGLPDGRGSEPLGADATAAGPGLLGAGGARRLAEVAAGLEALGVRLAALEAGPAAAPAAFDATAPAFEEGVRRVALRLAQEDVAFRLALATADRTRLGKDPPFARLARALELDAAQEDRFRKGIQGIQAELFQVLSEPRDDGVAPLERLQEAEGLPAADPRRAQLFVELFTQAIPGSDETYLERATALAAGFRARAREWLSVRQQELLDAVEVNLFEVKFD